MKNVIIFGILDTAELADYYFTNDSYWDVVSFTVHSRYIKEESFKGRPVIPFESIQDHFPPKDYFMFVPVLDNKQRENVAKEAKSKGYKLISYISSKACVFTDKIGENCFILENNTIQPFVEIGNNVILWSGNHIGHHSIIKDNVMFTSQVILSGHCIVEPYCYFGVNSTIRDALHIAEGTFVAMSAAITKDTEPWGVYKGVPAKKDN